MQIRAARPGDVPALREVIIAAVEPHRDMDFDEQGWRVFLEYNRPEVIQSRLQDPDFITLLAEIEGDIAGVITLRDSEWIYQLFVAPERRRQGIASRLWHAARALCAEHGNEGIFRVRSSSLAVPLYQSFGFVLSGDQRQLNGVRYFPMELAAMKPATNSDAPD